MACHQDGARADKNIAIAITQDIFAMQMLVGSRYFDIIRVRVGFDNTVASAYAFDPLLNRIDPFIIKNLSEFMTTTSTVTFL